MKLATAVTLYSGGPGSGCNPDKGKCGRKPGSGKSGRSGKARLPGYNSYVKLENPGAVGNGWIHPEGSYDIADHITEQPENSRKGYSIDYYRKTVDKLLDAGSIRVSYGKESSIALESRYYDRRTHSLVSQLAEMFPYENIDNVTMEIWQGPKGKHVYYQGNTQGLLRWLNQVKLKINE